MSRSRTIDLARQYNIRIVGAHTGDNLGRSVAGVGDVNGDGRPDIAIGAPGADTRSRTNNGAVYVVFGQGRRVRVDLRRLGRRGFRIDGRGARAAPPSECPSCAKVGGETIGLDVAGAGDVDKDGRADIVLSTVRQSGGFAKARAYVVFGRSYRAAVDLRRLGDRGFLMSAFLGKVDVDPTSVRAAGAGDVSGDGRSDVALTVPAFRYCGAPMACGQPFPGAGGGAYVVFGKRSSQPVDLLRLRGRGFRIIATEDFRTESFSVTGTGDMNGDKRSEVGLMDARSAYVVFGRAGGDVRLDMLGTSGFRVDGASAELDRGALSRAGDINSDGRADLLIGTPSEFGPMGAQLAEASVFAVFGRASPGTVVLSALGEAGRQLVKGEGGAAVATAGDANGDGIPDTLIGAPGASSRGRTHAGAVYVVYGSSEPSLDLRDALSASRGFRIDGPRGWKSCCIRGPIGQPRSFSSAGDINRDGRADVIVGSAFLDYHGRREAGAAYVVFSPR